jgi:hypothetical protein
MPEMKATLVLERMGPRALVAQSRSVSRSKPAVRNRSLIPYYSVYRPEASLRYLVRGPGRFRVAQSNLAITHKSGDRVPRNSVQAISRIQVLGGSRCQMGDLDRFSATSEQCLRCVRVVRSDLVGFDK